ncbi:MAG: hypothetical protein AAGE88_16525 [Actinomycetota bacterium]
MTTNPTPTPNSTDATIRSGRGRRRLFGARVAGALVLAACSGADETSAAVAGAETDAAPAEAAAAPESAAPAGVADVLVGQTPLGQVLIGPDGRTLYGFTNDVQAASTCYGTCAEAWPPVLVSDDWTAGPGLDFGIFATTVRDDGTRQLVAGAWPLYYFAGDAVAGDVNGQGSGNVWFAVDLNGGLIEGDAPAAAEGAADEGATDEAGAAGATEGVVGEADTDLGTILVDEVGLSLYGFLDDRDAASPTCNEACADAWPPVIVSSTEVPAGLDPEVFSVVTRDDGRNQLVAGIWPLYRFAGDGAPGDVNGQGSGEVWFLAAPDGSLIGAGGAPAEADAETTEDSAAETDGGTYDY